jgi:hypothetical protein
MHPCRDQVGDSVRGMRILVDAQLPRRLARWLAARRHDALASPAAAVPERRRDQIGNMRTRKVRTSRVRIAPRCRMSRAASSTDSKVLPRVAGERSWPLI